MASWISNCHPFPRGHLVSDVYTWASLPGTKYALLLCKVESDISKGDDGLFLLAREALGHCDPKIFVMEKEKAFSSFFLSPTSCKWCWDLMLSTQIANLSCY